MFFTPVNARGRTAAILFCIQTTRARGTASTLNRFKHFVFVSGTGNVYSPSAVNDAIKRVIKGHNAEEPERAKAEGREPVMLPDFSARHLRHTFCTRLCENESNLKFIQSVMGHSDISTTMDIYAEATEEKKQEIIGNLNGKIILR